MIFGSGAAGSGSGLTPQMECTSRSAVPAMQPHPSVVRPQSVATALLARYHLRYLFNLGAVHHKDGKQVGLHVYRSMKRATGVYRQTTCPWAYVTGFVATTKHCFGWKNGLDMALYSFLNTTNVVWAVLIYTLVAIQMLNILQFTGSCKQLEPGEHDPQLSLSSRLYVQVRDRAAAVLAGLMKGEDGELSNDFHERAYSKARNLHMRRKPSCIKKPRHNDQRRETTPRRNAAARRPPR
ncbi:Armadillo-like helical [Artemisia annua]|uniref:Armadillo-like helical n=1 Tax=Artemisia annua TaxID=35608 RepID=A0A2U1NVM1_ARTAN|nr:Armadillo-like helical [Artemisia annua]